MEIYGTIGPACADEAVLEQMFRNGMTGIRLNLSHITLPEAEEELELFQKAAAKCGLTPKLLIDMQGPELRIGKIQPMELASGQLLPLCRDTMGKEQQEAGTLPVPAVVWDALMPGQSLLLDDGKLLLQVEPFSGEKEKAARVLRGGRLMPRKSLALPGCRIETPALTETDRYNLSFAARAGVTGVMQPFVRSRQDLECVRQALKEAGCSHIRLFAKLENTERVDHLDELLPAADEIVIARGDLGNAVPLWHLPAVQKNIAARCLAAGKPFMVVTQMLSSMEHAPVPTRAEVSDIFNAVLDGASSVMVTGETAVGEYPAEVIRYLANTVAEAEDYRKRQM